MSTAARGGKSQAAFRTISEVADELDVAQHVLRFWESKFPQVRPLKRGGGRRYYRPEDIELLRDIRSLLYDEGYTIKGAQKLLRQRRAKPQASAKSPEAPAEPAATATPEPPTAPTTVPGDLPGNAPTPPEPAASPASGQAAALPTVADNPEAVAQPLRSPAPPATRSQSPAPAADSAAAIDKLTRLRGELADLREAVDAALASADR